MGDGDEAAESNEKRSAPSVVSLYTEYATSVEPGTAAMGALPPGTPLSDSSGRAGPDAEAR